ncbi:zf-HC2 domain-containing protein [Gemmatimonas sp.]|uniref:zf-HC2 domain-containing protein n=1 Tax=Gemmatimonas sp. TaxID=1962908 RepID=UPI003982F158
MTEWLGALAAGRAVPEDDATREARHEVLATLLAAYVDGELPPETTAQIDAHLLGCGRCRREITVHQSLVTRLSRVTRPAVSTALDERWRAAIAAAPAVSPMPAASIDSAPEAPLAAAAGRRRWIVGVLVVASVLAVALFLGVRGRAPAIVVLQPAPLAVSASVPLLELVAADFRAASARDLPGRARDLETVRRAVPFAVDPLRGADLQLVAVWTTEFDGEIAAVLAYKWRESLVMQYVVSDAWLFRSLPIRGAFAQGRAIASESPGAGLLAWSSGQGSSIVVADRPWPALVALHPRAR